MVGECTTSNTDHRYALGAILPLSVPATRALILKNLAIELYRQTAARFTMRLYSSAFENNQLIPKRFASTGENISPPLEWVNLPAGCRSLVLLCEDPDAPIKAGLDHPITH